MKIYLVAAFALLSAVLVLPTVRGACTDSAPTGTDCKQMCTFTGFAKTFCKKTCGFCPVPIQEVAIQFVTERNVLRAAEEKDKFAIQLCGGCMFDGHTAHVAINMQNAKWNVASGISVQMTVFDKDEKKITDNLKNNDPVQDFTFIYRHGYGDIEFEGVTGKHTTFTYTVTLTFIPPASKPATPPSCTSRWMMSQAEVRRMNKITNYQDANGNKRGQLLKRVFKLNKQGTVITGRERMFQLNYCYPGQPPYGLTVSTVAMDSKSGFGTYVCTPKVKPCNVRNSQYYDPSGGSVNFVDVKIRGNPDVGPLQVIVKGDGRHLKTNTFTLAASNYKKP